MATEPSYLEELRNDLLAVLLGSPTSPGVEPPPGPGEQELARQHGQAIVTGAGRVLSHPELDAVRIRLAAGPPSEADLATVGLLGRSLLRWRPRIIQVGDTALHAGHADEAELAARVVLAITHEWNTDPENGVAHLLLGRVAKLHNDLGSALDAFDSAVRLSLGREPRLAGTALDSLGLVLNELGRPDDALAAFETALKVEPTADGRVAILHNQALVLQELGEYRATAGTFDLVEATWRAAGAPPEKLATALDNKAVVRDALGEHSLALAVLDEARALWLPTGRVLDVAKNQLSRSSVLRRLGDEHAAHEAFSDAYRLMAELRANVDLAHYTDGFEARVIQAQRAAYLRLVAELGDADSAGREQQRLFDEGERTLQAGLDELHRADWSAADRLLADAEDLLARCGSVDGVLQAIANRGTLRMNAGANADAIKVLTRAHALARDLGAARHEMAALANLAQLSTEDPDVAGLIGRLDLLMQAIALERALPAIADALGMDARERQRFLWGDGGLDAALAGLCADHGAPDLAGPHWERALGCAHELGDHPDGRLRLVSRLADRLRYLRSGDATGGAKSVVAELETAVTAAPDELRLQVVGNGSLGLHLATDDPAAAIERLRAAADAQAKLAAQVPPRARPGVLSANPVAYSTLAQLLAASGDDAGGWAALQRKKGRRVLEAIGDDRPPDLVAVQNALASLGEHSTIVDIASVPDGVMAFVVDAASCTTVGPIAVPPDWLAGARQGDVREREAHAVEACLGDATLAAFVAAVDDVLPASATVFVVPDTPLENMPLHLVKRAGQAWSSTRTLSLLPAAGLVTSFSRTTGGRPAHSLVAGDSDGTLPGALDECNIVSAALATQPLVGPACTFAAVAAALNGDRLDVIHLAVHGRGDSARGGRAALRFATDDGGGAWVPFDELLALGLNAELVVLSGCSTAIAGPVHGQAAVSAAQAALEVGAGAVIACLWPVEDHAAATFMTALYADLIPRWNDGPADIRVAMAAARQATHAGGDTPNGGHARRDGRRDFKLPANSTVDPLVADALRWAPFVLFGDPIVAG